jgi:DNA-binding response OmpR family regulator
MDVIKPKTNVLVIDDDAFSRKLVEADLTHYGFAVDLACSGAEALERILADTNAYDAIVSDLRMPGESGVELLAKLRALGIATPFFIMTGDELFTEAETLQNGGNGFLKKPFRVGRLTIKITLALSKLRPAS